jgi:hypothetical protein
MTASLFHLTPEEQAVVTRARTIFARLQGTSIRKRLAVQIPEYREDMLKLEAALAKIQPEIQMVTDVLNHAYADGRRDTFYLTDSSKNQWPYASTKNSFDPRFVNFDLAQAVDHLRSRMREWAAQGPTQGQMLVAGNSSANIMGIGSGLMWLRQQIRQDKNSAKPLTAQIVRAYLANTPQNTPNLILRYLFFQFREFGYPLRMRSLDYTRLNELARAPMDLPPEKILKYEDIDIQTRVAPIMFVQERLLPVRAFLELSWQNMQMVQALPGAVEISIDGSNSDPAYALEHDFFHHSGTQFDSETGAYKMLNKYILAVTRDHPAWMPLLEALIFQYRHEDGHRLTDLPGKLDTYLTTSPLPQDETDHFFEFDSFREALREVGGEALFATQWDAFIQYLKGI